MPLLQVTGNNLDTQEKNILRRFYSDRFSVEHTSNLSLFLYSRSLVVMAGNENGAVTGSHLYSFKDRKDLEEIIAKDDLINAENTSGKLYVHNDHFCLVPTVLFDPSVKTTYLNFIAAIDEDKMEVFYEGVYSNNIQVVGAVGKEILSLLDNALPDLEVNHAACLALSYLCENKTDMLGQELYVFAELEHIYLAAFIENELQLFNRFPVEGNADFLKYAFSAAHQLSFDRMHCKVTLLGDLASVAIDVEPLKQYFKNIQTRDPQFNQTYSPGAERFKETKLLEAFWTL